MENNEKDCTDQYFECTSECDVNDKEWEEACVEELKECDIPEPDWREEYKGYTSSKYELDLLENGPKSLAQSWMMQALHNKWKKIKGIKDPEPPDVSSSLQEWEQSIKKYEQ